MGWVVFTVLLGILFWTGVGMVTLATSTDTKGLGGLLLAGGIVGEIILTLVCSLHTLGTGQTALVYDFSGKLASSQSNPGIIWTAPWQNIKKADVFLQNESFDLGTENSAVSKDQQAIFANIAINYEIDSNTVIYLYRTVGPNWKSKLVDSRVLQDFKEVTSTFTAQEITTKRQELRKQTRDRLKTEFKPYSIRVVDFFVKNLHYSNAYERAIDEKNRQVQKSLQAQAKVNQAIAEANQVKARANGEAYAIRAKGQALREHPEVLKLNAIEKLNPNAAVIFCSAGDCPSILGNLTAGDTTPVPAGK